MSECYICRVNSRLKESCGTSNTIKNLNKKLQTKLTKQDSIIEKLEATVKHYAGEPFKTNDIYMDIFNLFKIENDSVTSFDSDTFALLAVETLKEIEKLRGE
jgi:hypothetical protein